MNLKYDKGDSPFSSSSYFLLLPVGHPPGHGEGGIRWLYNTANASTAVIPKIAVIPFLDIRFHFLEIDSPPPSPQSHRARNAPRT